MCEAFLPAAEQDESEFEAINMIKYLLVLEERLLQIQQDTEVDESLQVLKAAIQKAWPEHKSSLPSIISPFFNMRDELSIQDGLIFKGERVVVPRASRSKLLKQIHSSHLGVNSCLNRACKCVYWPGMTADIKNRVSTCEACREHERSQAKEAMMSPEMPAQPWQRVAADLFEFEGKMYLVTSNYYSDFFEFDHLRSP